MSKTNSTCICETNQVVNEPQENVFFFQTYRTVNDFPGEFLRSAKSTAPIQICALFSCYGPDSIGAKLNIALNEELCNIVANYANKSVLDFESFCNQVINVLNLKVCKASVACGGQKLQVSMTLLLIEGDTLRVISVGNTKAVLVRDNKIMSLTEDQTLAHRYVQMGAITPEQEATHPDNMTLTQYLGKMPQDGEIQVDKRVHLKLKDNDELCIMGLGLSKKLKSNIRNNILVRPTQTETKAKELISAAYNYGIKSGLSVIVMKIESTFLLPGDAVLGEAANSEPVSAEPIDQVVKSKRPSEEVSVAGNSETRRNISNSKVTEESKGDTKPISRDKNIETSRKGKSKDTMASTDKKEKTKNLLILLALFLVCVGIGYGGMFLIFNAKSIISKVAPASEEVQNNQTTMYVISDNTSVYSSENLESTVIATLSKGDSVIVSSTGDTFSNITTVEGVVGYILNVQLSPENPLEEVPEENVTDDTIEVQQEASVVETTESVVEETLSNQEDNEDVSETVTETEATTVNETTAETTSETTSETTAETTAESVAETSEETTEAETEATTEETTEETTEAVTEAATEETTEETTEAITEATTEATTAENTEAPSDEGTEDNSADSET